MSESEYMTGRELCSIFYGRKVTDWEAGYLSPTWDAFAHKIKCPKPKTLLQAYDSWLNNGGFTVDEECEIEELRVLLNEARQKLDGGL